MAAIKFNRMFVQSFVLGLGAYLAIRREVSPGTIIAASIIVGKCIQPGRDGGQQLERHRDDARGFRACADTFLRSLPPISKRSSYRPQGRTFR